MTEAEFWLLTPEKYEVLAARWTVKIKREARNFAALMALIANINRGKDDRAYTADDFIGKPKKQSVRARRKAVTAWFDSLAAEGLVKKEAV